MSNNQNPFSDFFSAFANNNPFASAFDFDQAVNSGRNNAKAFTDAAKAAGEGLQAIARRQSEIAQKTAEEASKFFKEASSAKSIEDALAKNAKFTESQVKKALDDAKDLGEIANKSSKEAFEVLSKRAAEAASEVASSATTATNAAKKKAAA